MPGLSMSSYVFAVDVTGTNTVLVSAANGRVKSTCSARAGVMYVAAVDRSHLCVLMLGIRPEKLVSTRWILTPRSFAISPSRSTSRPSHSPLLGFFTLYGGYAASQITIEPRSLICASNESGSAAALAPATSIPATTAPSVHFAIIDSSLRGDFTPLFQL